MKRRLDHLPEGKRRELEFVTDLLREGFAEAVAERRAPRLKNGKLLKIILFGSYELRERGASEAAVCLR